MKNLRQRLERLERMTKRPDEYFGVCMVGGLSIDGPPDLVFADGSPIRRPHDPNLTAAEIEGWRREVSK